MASEPGSPKITCPICKGALRLTGKAQHPVRRGVFELHTFACDPCLFETTRVVDTLASLRPERILPSTR